jgi:hypothetical protein
MLKAQVRSKISALGCGWHDVEDILTGDFFGVLDYLPRRAFISSFISWVAGLNETISPPGMDDVAWDEIEFLFWPMLRAREEAAEPDLVIISNKWVLVVEVKLGSGLGDNQPWREYCVGKEIARDRGLPPESVFYLVLARSRLEAAASMAHVEARKQQELAARTFHLRWSQAVALIQRWLEVGPCGHALLPEQARMLSDLLLALRRRRSIVFSGFDFLDHRPVTDDHEALFCPERFGGFLAGAETTPVLLMPRVSVSPFTGFLVGTPAGIAPQGAFVFESFSGFLRACPPCRPGASLELGAR